MGVNRAEDWEVLMVEDEEVKVGEENGSEIVRWESLMPKMVLRVLLVEADDSTRQIIAALLRKCNYKVAATSDGLKAWEILKQRHSNIDLILTELDLPSISGYALLTLIMEHDSCKNIPVIIMSSQDSINMVLKCMLKGATDFLIKPVRKNELKNLWRHVWKRLALNVHDAKNTTGLCKAEATFDDHPANNHSSDNVSFSQKNSKVYESAADTQMNSKEEAGLRQKEKVHFSRNIKLEELAPDTGDSGLEATKLASLAHPSKDAVVSTAIKASEDGSCTGIVTEDDNYTHKANSDLDGHELSEPLDGAKDLIGRINKQRCTCVQSGFGDGLDSHKAYPQLELSLRRSVDPELNDNKMDERHVLNHCKASAFSWYSGNKKPNTFFSSPHGDMIDMKDAPDASGPANPLVGPAWQTDGGLLASNGSMIQQEFRSPTSAFQREESPFLTSPSRHSESGTHSSTQGHGLLGDTVNNSSEQSFPHELRKSVDQHGSNNSLVDLSGNASCNDLGSQHKSSTYGSASEVIDVNPTSSDMVGTSAAEESVRDNGGNTLDHDQFRSRTGIHSAEREAALAKFRLKRKGRCFEKKVRYQSRKRLAEQRPRVKGQFVRQAPKDEIPELS